MTDDQIEAGTSQEIAEAASGPPYCKRPTHPDVADRMHRRGGGGELRAQAPLEAEREMRLHGRTQIAAPRERRKQHLDAAVQVSAVAVQRSYQFGAEVSVWYIGMSSRASRARSNRRSAAPLPALPRLARSSALLASIAIRSARAAASPGPYTSASIPAAISSVAP